MAELPVMYSAIEPAHRYLKSSFIERLFKTSMAIPEALSDEMRGGIFLKSNLPNTWLRLKLLNARLLLRSGGIVCK